jgi:hypothetical protein
MSSHAPLTSSMCASQLIRSVRQTMNGIRSIAKGLPILLCFATPLYAHAPYERVYGTYESESGRQVQLVLSYVDGIVGTDPVKLVLRDTSGEVLHETPFMRDAALMCPSLSSCRLFEYDPPVRLRPLRVVRVRESGFEPESSLWLTAVGSVLPLWEHWLELLVACVALAAVPLAAQFLASRRRSPLVVAAWVVLVVGAIPWLFFWLFGVGLNLPVAGFWVVAGTLFLSLGPFMVRRLLRAA